jgi:acetyl-CoA C-acetyltransferase
MVDASKAALADTGIAQAACRRDRRRSPWSASSKIPSRGAPHPHGHNTNLPGTLARDIGASPEAPHL